MTARGQWLAVGSLVLAFAGLLGAGVALTSDVGLVAPGTRAPDFRAVDVTTGQTVTLAPGSVVLSNIWATWCAPCALPLSWQAPSDRRR